MRSVNSQQAKTHLSRLVEEAARGEDIVIAKAGKPMVRLVPVVADTTPRKLGVWKGKVWIADDFDETSEELIRVQATAARVACGRMTTLALQALRDSVERASCLPSRPRWESKVAAHAEIFQLLADAAGSPAATDPKSSQVRVIRDGTVIYTTVIDSLKRFSDDAREVQEGFECGLHLQNFDDVKVGDVLEVFETREVERTSLDEPATA
jgi:prevent-host-death family protein